MIKKFICSIFCSVSVLAALPASAQQSSPQASHQVCEQRFAAYRQSKIALGVPEKHLPYLDLARQQPERDTVIFIHGLFESPYFFKGVTQNFSENGYNTLTILLPGHWEQDVNHIDHVSYQDWLDELDKAVSMASCFGHKIVFAGHSLGGALAIAGVLKYPGEAAGLAVWAPALQLNVLPNLAGTIGTLTRLDGNLFMSQAPDLDEIPKYSGNAAMQIFNLNQYLAKTYGERVGTLYGPTNQVALPLSYLGVYKKIRVPTFAVIPENDPAVSPSESLAMFQQISAPKQLITYPKDSPVWHANVTKSKLDTYKVDPAGFNHHFGEMMDSVEQFFSAQIQPAD